MSIVKMRRLRLIALSEDRDRLMEQLLRAGCVEISEPEEPPEGLSLSREDSAALAAVRGEQAGLQRALDILRRYAPQKTGLLTPRAAVKESELMDPEAAKRSLALAEEVNGHAKALGQLSARESHLLADKLALEPWSAYDVPLEETGTARVELLLGTVPNTADFAAMSGAAEEAAGEICIDYLGQDREQQYLAVTVMRDKEAPALEALRGYGFAFAQLKGLTGTVKENLRHLEGELAQVRKEQAAEEVAIRALGPRQQELKQCADYVQQRLSLENAKERLLSGGAIVCLEGWAAEPDIGRLEKLLGKYDCAYELTEPKPEEYAQVPVKLKNSKFTRCMNTVTEMYSLPAYDGVDPNPLMAPFFILFFGIMMADMAYGLLMVIGAAVYLSKARPKNRSFMEMIFWCGISTFIVGALTGGFFGDFIPQLLKIINPASTFEMPALFTPLNDTVAIMIGSMILGAIQVFTGMGVSVWYKTKNGDFIDALFNEITWWIILAGLGVLIGGMLVPGAPAVLGTLGKVILIAGGLMLVFGGTREAKGFGKVTSLVGLIYNGVTGFFSDILSYVRLMALMLSGSVIASVFNTLGATFGNVVLFVIISMVGNALNFALNILGCYVHDLRLQCLEFFGRFYKEGGKPYKPLAIDTKYVEVIKEEN